MEREDSEDKTLLGCLDRLEAHEQTFVKDIKVACVEAFYEESRIYESMADSNVSLVEAACLPCWTMFPQFLEVHEALLQKVRTFSSLDVLGRAQRVAESLVEIIPFLAPIHEVYATQFQNACNVASSTSHTLMLPLGIMDEYKLCLAGLQSITKVDLSASFDILNGSVKRKMTDERRQISRKRRLKDKLQPFSVQHQALLFETSLQFFTGRGGSIAQAIGCIFESAVVIFDEVNDKVLLALELSPNSPASVFQASEDDTVVILAKDGCFYLTFSSPDSCSEWMKQLRNHPAINVSPPIQFDLQQLLASIDSFPKAWLVTDTETSNQELQSSTTMWVIHSTNLTPRLHQFYLMKDMIIYGEIKGPRTCQFVGYILGENITVHDPPTAKCRHANAFELEVLQDDSATSLLVCPVHYETRSQWIEQIRQLKANQTFAESSAKSEEVYVLEEPSSVPRLDQVSSHTHAASPQNDRKDDDEKSVASTTCTPEKQTARKLHVDEVARSSSETEIESEDDSLDSMLCAKNPKKRKIIEIHGTEEIDDKDDVESIDDAYCAETPEAKKNSVGFVRPPSAVNSNLEVLPPKPASPEPMRDLISSTQVMEGSAIAFLQRHSPLEPLPPSSAETDQAETKPSVVSPTPETKGIIPQESTLYETLVKSSESLGTTSESVESYPEEAKPDKKGENPNEREDVSEPKAHRAKGRGKQAKATAAKRVKKTKEAIDKPVSASPAEAFIPVENIPRKRKTSVPSTQEMEGGAIQFLRDGPFAATKSTLSSSQVIRIALTGFADPQSLIIKITCIEHAVYEDDVIKATHIVAPSGVLKRTVKILCGISCCLHILDEQWLHTSAKMGHAADEESFCLTDPVKEQLWGCSLRKTMYEHTLAQRQTLLSGHSFFITKHKSVLPPPEDLERIIICAGGKMASVGELDSATIVITSVDAASTAAVKKILKLVQPTQCYTPELLLRCILTQKLALGDYHVELPEKKGRKK
ncbi:hypothetical protein LEN26_007390 [Aphanomyces euteiches]|nr:hypothetical protein LEN26_007390 [Aphanomyces euteiches]